jgi:cell division protein FtsZ
VTVKEAIVQQELPFEVEPAPEPEPAIPEPDSEPESEGEPKMVDKLRNWLNNIMTTVTE